MDWLSDDPLVALERLRIENRDPDLLPLAPEDFLTAREAEDDPTVDSHERDEGWLRR